MEQAIGALPALQVGREGSLLRRASQFKGWFEELADPDVVPTVMPTYLEEFAFFKDSLAIKTSASRRCSARSRRRNWPTNGPTT